MLWKAVSMTEEIKELTNDFKQALSEIDFKKYDPYSRTFMKPLFIGQLLLAMKSVNADDDVEEELDGAETYINKYLATNDNAYKEMASDELKHAGILIKKHLINANEAQRQKLTSHEKERQNLYKMLNSKESD